MENKIYSQQIIALTCNSTLLLVTPSCTGLIKKQNLGKSVYLFCNVYIRFPFFMCLFKILTYNLSFFLHYIYRISFIIIINDQHKYLPVFNKSNFNNTARLKKYNFVIKIKRLNININIIMLSLQWWQMWSCYASFHVNELPYTDSLDSCIV